MSKKIEEARRIFDENFGLIASTASRFRKTVLAEMVGQIGVTMNSAASMYNVCKKEAENAGRLEPGQIGRKPRTDTVEAAVVAATATQPAEPAAEAAATAEEPAAAPEADEDLPWALVNGKTITYHASRGAARAARTVAGAGTVKKAADVNAEASN